MRLDKFLCDMNCGTRSLVKKDIKNGLVSVNGIIIRRSEFQVDEMRDQICYQGSLCQYEKYVYYMLNKPAGVVSATRDEKNETVLSFFHAGPGQAPKPGSGPAADLFPVGRLDKDTEGLLLLTNDGALAHRLLSPVSHVDKTYECLLAAPATEAQIQALEKGVDIGEKRLTLPAKVSVQAPQKILLTITEGKFHQVKRMLKTVGNEVVHLKRVRMGALSLDEQLAPGQYRKLTQEEIKMLQSTDNQLTPLSEMILSETDAVIFDLDGSLVDSMWMWHAIDVEYLGRFGLEPPENLQAMIGGRSFSETAVFFKEMFQLPDDLEQIKEDWNRMAWDKYTHEVPLKKGAAAFIERCLEQQIKLGIATSNSRELVENVISVHGLTGHFDCILTGCEVQKGKPAPDIYLAVAQALDVSPARCLVFEDIVHGIMAGKAAGMKVCAVYDETSAWQDAQKKELADYFIHDFKELI